MPIPFAHVCQQGNPPSPISPPALMRSDSFQNPPRRVLVITAHGIRTFGKWQDDFADMLEKAAKEARLECKVLAYEYPFFSALDYLIPGVRSIVESDFLRQVQREFHAFKPDDIYFVGHSFGTEVIMRSLDNLLRIDHTLHVKGVILAGSTLPETYAWDRLTLFAQGDVWLLNECGRRDIPLLISKFLRPNGGAAGRFGLRGLTGRHLFNRFYDTGHSGLFDASHCDTVMTSWVDLIIKGTPPKRINQSPRSRLTALEDSLASSFAVLRALLILSPLWLLCLIILWQWRAMTVQNDVLRKERNDAIMQRGRANEQLYWVMETISRHRDINPKTRSVFLEQLQKWVFVDEIDPEWQKSRDLQRVSYYVVRGDYYERDGLYNDALNDYRSAVTLFSNSLENEVVTNVTARQLAALVRAAGARLLLKRNAVAEAMVWLAEAERLVTVNDASAPSLTIRNKVARCYVLIAELAPSYDERYELLSQVLSRFDSIGASEENAYDRSYVRGRLGDIQLAKGDFAKSATHYRDALQVIGYDKANPHVDDAHRRWAFFPTVGLGRALYQAGDKDSAKLLANDALPLALLTLKEFEREDVSHEEKEYMARHLLFFANLSDLVGNRDSFVKVATAAREFYEGISPARIKRDESIALALVYIAMILQELDDASKVSQEQQRSAFAKAVATLLQSPQTIDEGKASVNDAATKPIKKWAAEAIVLKSKAELLMRVLDEKDQPQGVATLVKSIRTTLDSINPDHLLEETRLSTERLYIGLEDMLPQSEQIPATKTENSNSQ